MSENDRFLNPYNFIPFPKHKSPCYGDTDAHTGVITYTITTRSPLFIPNTSSEYAFGRAADGPDHKSYDFYSYTELEAGRDYSETYETPVIPGSELRGMIRGIYETLTGSCMGVLNSDTLPVKRNGEVFKAALIRKETINGEKKFTLVEAEDCIYRESDNFRDRLFARTDKKEGQQVFFRKERRDRGKPLITSCSAKKDPAHPECGYLIKGMKGPETGNAQKEKHNCHVFVQRRSGDRDRELISLDRGALDRLEQVLTSYQEQPTAAADSYREYQENLETFLKQEENGYFPVYYSIVGEGQKNTGKPLLYLSPASITKEISNHSIGELAGEFTPCGSRVHRCPACDLFGMTGENNEQAFASRIRFADAAAEKRENREYYDPIVTLEELGGPKLSNTEFYLEKPKDADFWTYDYYTEGGVAYPCQARLRGRKYYWHQPGKKLPKGIEKTERNKTVRPVKSGVHFEGRLYFNGISDRQLRELLWILNGGNESEQPCGGPIAWKLGGGKPLGLGSVELKVKELRERCFVMDGEAIRYLNESVEDIRIPGYEETGFLAECREDLLTICSLKGAEGKTVTWPVTREQLEGMRQGKPMEEGFKWFAANHAGYDYKRRKDVGMPNARVQMWTLCALPRIQGVGTLPTGPRTEEDVQKKIQGRESGMRQGGYAGNRPYPSGNRNQGKGSPRREGEGQGNSVFGKVTGYNKNRTAASIQLDDGRKASIQYKNIAFLHAENRENISGKVDEALPLESRVEVVYEGRQPNGFEKWKCIGIVK